MKPAKEVVLAPSLLISMPQLSDPYFSRAVILILDHNDEGSFGITLNHPSTLEVAELVGHLEVEWCGPASQVVGVGGPVMPKSGWVLHDGCPLLPQACQNLDEAMEESGHLYIQENLYLTTSEDNIRILAENPPNRSQFFLGYSGWSAGQLVEEMTQGSWLHADFTTDLLLNTTHKQLWQESLAHLGVNAQNLVQAQGVH